MTVYWPARSRAETNSCALPNDLRLYLDRAGVLAHAEDRPPIRPSRPLDLRSVSLMNTFVGSMCSRAGSF